MTKKLGIVVSCYDKVDDTLAQLDILKFDHHRRPVMVSYMGYKEPPPEFSQYELVQFPSPGFTSGPLMSLVHAVRRASQLGWDYLVYRNGDDWIFDHDLKERWLTHMVANDQLCGGYNWFGANNLYDVTMNELIISVPHFLATADRAVEYFYSSDQRFTCEYKMAWWVNESLPDPVKQFYRLPDREQEHGVGRLVGDIPYWYHMRGREPSSEVMASLNDNNRFFCRKWKMIGSHLNMARFVYWTMIRDEVPYRHELERMTHFNRWLRSIVERTTWNTEIKNYSRLERQDRRYYPVRTVKLLPKRLMHGKYPSPNAPKRVKISRTEAKPYLNGINPVVYMDNQ